MSKEIAGKKNGTLYLESYKQEMVKEVERERNLTLVCDRHGLGITTLQRWVKLYASSTYQPRQQLRRRSVSERAAIAREIVSGSLSIEEAQLKYTISHRFTLTKWVLEYKRDQNKLLELLPAATVLAETESLPDSESSTDLKLAELKIRALEVMLDIASKEFKVDIRKKFGAKP